MKVCNYCNGKGYIKKKFDTENKFVKCPFCKGKEPIKNYKFEIKK